MIAMETDRLVDEYLSRLEEAAAHLQRARRAELVAEIREHIEAALRQEEDAGEVAVRNVLERLGPPEEIVEAAEPPPDVEEDRAGKLEIAALVTLVVPLVGWLFGSALVVASGAWSRREKIVGIALALAPVVLPLLGTILASSGSEESVRVDRPVEEETVGDTSGGAGLVELVFLFGLAGLPSALFLGWRLRRHSAPAA